MDQGVAVGDYSPGGRERNETELPADAWPALADQERLRNRTLLQAARRIGGSRGFQVERTSLGIRQFRRWKLGDSNPAIHLEVLLAASGAIAFARLFIAQAGQLVTAADAIAIAGR